MEIIFRKMGTKRILVPWILKRWLSNLSPHNKEIWFAEFKIDIEHNEVGRRKH